MLVMQNRVREHRIPYTSQETLAAGIARGRYEEHQRACQVMQQAINEVISARFPLIAAFLEERINKIDSFPILHQFICVVSTAWTPEDVHFVDALFEEGGDQG